MNRALIKPVVAAFFDKRTCSVQYLVSCPDTKRCAVIDPVLDFEPKSGATGTQSADAVLEHIRSEAPLHGLPGIVPTRLRGSNRVELNTIYESLHPRRQNRRANQISAAHGGLRVSKSRRCANWRGS